MLEAVRPRGAPQCVEGGAFDLDAVQRAAAFLALDPRDELTWEITCFMLTFRPTIFI